MGSCVNVHHQSVVLPQGCGTCWPYQWAECLAEPLEGTPCCAPACMFAYWSHGSAAVLSVYLVFNAYDAPYRGPGLTLAVAVAPPALQRLRLPLMALVSSCLKALESQCSSLLFLCGTSNQSDSVWPAMQVPLA